jgi:hypothetical protein
MNLVCSYWDAQDTRCARISRPRTNRHPDKFDAKIKNKQTAGNPLSDIIVEDTQTAIHEHRERILTVDMRDPASLAKQITQFFHCVEPEIESHSPWKQFI